MASFENLEWSVHLLGGHPGATLKQNISSTSYGFDVGKNQVVRVVSDGQPCWVETNATTTAATTLSMIIPSNTPTIISTNHHRYLNVYCGTAADVYVTYMHQAAFSWDDMPTGSPQYK